MPGPSPTEPAWAWTYDSLTEALRDRRVLLRVHTLPLTPLPSPRNDPSTSGFTARNIAFRGIDPEQYAIAISGQRRDRDWAEGPYMRQMIIDHINNRPPTRRWPGGGRDRHFERRRIHIDEQTPWISTTGHLDWAIWYIARLLSRGQGQGRNEVHLAIINNSCQSWLEGELKVSPFLNRPRAEWQDLGGSGITKERYLAAQASAGWAKEVLFYGRIFGNSLLADLTFTHRELPFALPFQFWNTSPHTDQGTWLSRLRWIPQSMPVDMAFTNMRRPRILPPMTVCFSQPVNSALQVHAARQRFPACLPVPDQTPCKVEAGEVDVEMRSDYSSDSEAEEAEAMLIDVA